MTDQEIELLADLPSQPGRLYYYQGNFFCPLVLHGAAVGQVKRRIRQFHKTHADLIKSDRSSPDYLDLTQLADTTPHNGASF